MANKKLLIISPYFAPINAADMQRVRTSLPYYKQFGWDAEIVTVHKDFTDAPTDNLLLESVDDNVPIHYVKALSKKFTSKLGLGSVALRALPFYLKKVNQLLQANRYHLIYFSTTQFPVCILGAYWKRKFNIPYVIDMQDPWHSDYYQNKPKLQRPKKYWLSYRLNKYLEPIALKSADGLISVSESYIVDLKNRYLQIASIPAATITFGIFEPDLKIALAHKNNFVQLLNNRFKNIVYIGRGGNDMHKAIEPVFKAVKMGLINFPDVFAQLKLYFIGTSYAPAGQGAQTIIPLAKLYDIEQQVIEITDRISYYHALNTLQQADALFIPGSDDPQYTASKIYPYLLVKKPVLAVFNAGSPALAVLNECGAEHVLAYNTVGIEDDILKFLKSVISNTITKPVYNDAAIQKYSAENTAMLQCNLFNQAYSNHNK